MKKKNYKHLTINGGGSTPKVSLTIKYLFFMSSQI